MPTTIATLIIILFAVLPGLPAYMIYRIFYGKDWRVTDWEKIVGIIAFSTGGLIVYTIVSSVINLPPTIYIIPATFDTGSFGISRLMPIALSYLGHLFASIIIAILTIFGVRLFSQWTSTSPYPAAWDDFIRVDVQKHWVVVRLINGEAYAGMLKYVDTSVYQAERDLVLAEPAQFVEKEKNYKVIPYQQLFLPAALISSVAVIYDPNVDKRITKIGSTLFPEIKSHV